MMADVFIKVGDNGKDVPDEVIEAINAILRSGLSTVRATITVNDVEYIIEYRVIKKSSKEEKE